MPRAGLGDGQRQVRLSQVSLAIFHQIKKNLVRLVSHFLLVRLVLAIPTRVGHSDSCLSDQVAPFYILSKKQKVKWIEPRKVTSLKEKMCSFLIRNVRCIIVKIWSTSAIFLLFQFSASQIQKQNGSNKSIKMVKKC